MLKELQTDELPVNGLFFLCPEGLSKLTRDNPPTGVAFAVSTNGLVLTCTHVFQILGLVPGQETWLYHWVYPIRIKAKILAEGWCGHNWREFERNPKDPRWTNVSMMKPDDWREDLAFLRLDATKIEPCPLRASGNTVNQEAESWLDRVRVLPLGLYFSPPGQAYSIATAWRFASTNFGEDPQVGEVQILKDKSSPWSTIALRGNEIAEGFSGSPLWDESRKLVVGLVKRGAKELVKDRVLGTDARAFTNHPEVLLKWDAALDRYFENLRLLCGGQYQFYDTYISPKVLISFKEKSAGTCENGLEEALRILGQPRNLIVSGEGGVGKTSLLKRICLEVLCAPSDERYRARWFPLYCIARDLAFGNGSLIERIYKVIGNNEADERIWSIRDLLKANDLKLLVLIDGIDEIDRTARTRFLSELVAVTSSLHTSLRLFFVCSSRPNPEVTDFLLQSNGFVEILVMGFDHQRQRQLVELKCGAESNEFWRKAELLDYFSGDMTPLQIEIATKIYSITKDLPPRQIELPRAYFQAHLDRYIKLKSNHGLIPAPFKRYGSVFNEDGIFETILSDVAYACYVMKDRPYTESVIEWLASSYDQENRPHWLNSTELLASFINNEIALGSGVCFLGGNDDAEKGKEIEWRHRLFLEQFAAISVVHRRTRQPQLLKSYLKGYSDPGQHQFIIDLLLAIEFAGGGDFIERYVGQLVARASMSPQAVVLVVLVCGEGIYISHEIMGRAVDRVAHLIMIGLVNTALKCADIYISNRSPSLKQAIKRPPLKELMQDALQKRLRSGALKFLDAANFEKVIKSMDDLGVDVQIHQREEFSNEDHSEPVLPYQTISNLNEGRYPHISGLWISSNGDHKLLSIPAQDLLEYIVEKTRNSSVTATNDEIVKQCLQILIEVVNVGDVSAESVKRVLH